MSRVMRLALPEELEGSWEHAVILTYGADLSFFEQDLWRKLGRTRNRIVLVDDRQLASAYSEAATDARLRHVNANYLAAPVRNAAAAHAKIILLAASDTGRLFVGSGNLGMHGYASQGEVFCRYDYARGETSHLPAFRAVHDLLEGIARRGYIDEIAVAHLRHVWRGANWLYQTVDTDWRPVRHNLERPLLDQLVAAADGRPVEDVIIHAPFWDPGCQALRAVIERLRPKRVLVLVQVGETAVDGARMEAVLNASGAPWQVRTVEAEEHGTYLHAKFVLVHQRNRAVCLQGSANLSLAALVHADPQANIEACNLLEGRVDAFDGLVEALDLSAPCAPTSVELRVWSEDGEDRHDVGLVVHSAEWDNPWLRVHLSDAVDPGAQVTVLTGGVPVEATMLEIEGATVSAAFDGPAADRLDRVVAVALQIRIAGTTTTTDAVYPYRRAALRNLLQRRGDDEMLARAGGLNVHDHELMRLLEALNDTLVIDGESVWRTGGNADSLTQHDADGPRQSVDDIDWEMLRRHPKVAQYMDRSGAHDATGLQLLLSSVTDHFRGLGSGSSASSSPPDPDDNADFRAEDLQGLLGDEIDVEDADQPSVLEQDSGGPAPAHHQHALKRFVRRYLRGVEDPAFVELVGPSLMADNFAIFNAILTLLPSSGLVQDQRFCLEAQLRLWELWWGGAHADGVLAELDDDELLDVAGRFSDAAVDVAVVRAVARASAECADNRWHDEHVRLRNLWRRMLTTPVLAFTRDVLAMAVPTRARWTTGGRTGPASRIAVDLHALAWMSTEHDVRDAVAGTLDVPADAVRLERAVVNRGDTSTARVDVIVADVAINPLTAATAATALAAWAGIEPSRDYYRVNHRATKAVAVHDRRTGETWWYDPDREDRVDLPAPSPSGQRWARSLHQVMRCAREADRMRQVAA